jgi:hypothetical protein
MNSHIQSRWKMLAKKLRAIYKNQGKDEDIIKRDLDYLGEAYRFTEKLWLAQLRKKVPKVVMLSEAPLFGENRNYFYNPETPPSAFFHFNDAKAVAGEAFADGKKFDCDEKKKAFLIETVTKNGFLILDLFPYALNKKTALNYRNGVGKKIYRNIFRETIVDHLSIKLDLIKEACKRSNPPLFLYRYKRLKDHLDHDVKGVFCCKGLDAEINSVGGKNMSLDRPLLGNAIKTKRGD